MPRQRGSPEEAGSIETRTSWAVAIAAHLLLATTMSGGMMVLLVALKPIAAEFGWPRQYPSLAYALGMIAGGAGGIVLGRYTDRHGMDFPVFCVVIASAAGIFAMAWIDALWQLFFVHAVLFGLVGPSAGFSFLVAVVTRWFDRNRGTAVAIVASGQSVAGVFGPLAAGYAMEAVGWRLTYWFAGILVLASSLLCALVVRRPPPRVPRTPAGVAGGRLSGLKPTALPLPLLFALLAGCIVSCCVPMSLGLGHLVSHVSDLGHPAVRAVEVMAAVMAVSVVSRVGTGWIADRIGALAALLITSATQAAGCALFAMVESLPALYAVGFIYGLGTGGVLVNYALVIRDFFPANAAGQRIGMIYFFGTIGMSFGGWAGGLIFDYAGSYAPAFWMAFGFNLLNLVLVSVVLAAHWRGRAALAAAAA